ncbi:MAG TPA: glutathione binding-like protein [Mizugakiibacter sp.]
MQLYFAPLACSLATRIAAYEADLALDYVQVDTRAKRLQDGSDFLPINPLGQVPVLRTDEGWLLTENAAILQYLAGQVPDAALAPATGAQHARLQQWLGFISTELHKAVFVPLLDRQAPPEVKAYARDKAARRLDVLQAHLAGRDCLVDRFSVADAYLFVVLNWAAYVDVDLSARPAVADFRRRIGERPAVARALAEEMALYAQQQAQRAAVAQR